MLGSTKRHRSNLGPVEEKSPSKNCKFTSENLMCSESLPKFDALDDYLHDFFIIQ